MPHPISLLLSLSLSVIASLPVALAAGDEAGSDTMLLIANPDRQPHGYFRQSVVLAKRHGPQGSVGVIINRPSEYHLGEVLTGLPALEGSDKHLYRGGPVSPKMLVYLYRDDEPRADALAVGDGYFLTFNAASIEDLLSDPEKLNRVRVFNGYTGWGKGQLQQEIGRRDWYVMPLQSDYLFSEQPERLWQQLIKRFSGDWVRAPQWEPIDQPVNG